MKNDEVRNTEGVAKDNIRLRCYGKDSIQEEYMCERATVLYIDKFDMT